MQLSFAGPGASIAMIEFLLVLGNWEYIRSFARPLHLMTESILVVN
jgi:hypothetical protein